MKLREFLTLVTPRVGIKYAAELYSFQADDKIIKTFRHTAYHDVSEWATGMITMDAEERHTYFALAGFAEPIPAIDRRTGKLKLTKNGKQKYDYRTQQLAIAARSLWIDLDCGEAKAEKGLGYATQKEAAQEVVKFCRLAKLPAPIMVNSGYGLHCYWPFVEDVPARQWMGIAKIWRQVLNVYQIRSDASRDIDIASVLRPPKTNNRKGTIARPVVVMNKAPVQPTPVAQFLGLLKNALEGKEALPAPSVPLLSHAPSYAEDRSQDMATDLPQIPAFAEDIVRQCNQMLQFHSNNGDAPEPVWRGLLGVLKHTTEGEKIAHEWSALHPNYSADETQQKLDGWATGPATCAYFDKCNPDGCSGCSLKGTITSPIQLGYRRDTMVKTADITAEVNGVEAVIEGITLPKGYIQTAKGGLAFLKTDSEGMIKPIMFARCTFYPVARIRSSDNTYSYQFRVIKSDGTVRLFPVEGAMTAKPTVVELLASQEVFMTNISLSQYMRQYVTDFCAHMVDSSAEVRTYVQFGWHAERSAFVIGEREYTVDGIVKQAVVDKNAGRCSAAFGQVAASPEPWVSTINWIYNRPGMTHMQYALCSGFGSLLGVFQSDLYAGIPLALTDPSSGKGKTTVGKLALMAFGNWRAMTIGTKDGATPMARIATLATMGNLPVLIDEITDIDPQELSTFLYAVSNGRDRLRLSQTGELRDSSSWNLSAYLTANEGLTNKLATLSRDVEANQVRIFEISTRDYPVPILDSVEVDKRVTDAQKGSGAPGDAFIRFVVQNQAVVEQLIFSIKQRIQRLSPETDAPQWRFYRYHVECTLAAAAIMRRLKLVDFDIRTLQGWAVEHLARLAKVVTTEKIESNAVEAQLNKLITTVRKSLLVTNGFSRNDKELPSFIPQDRIAGRFIIGNTHTPEGLHNVVILSLAHLREWCREASVDCTHLRDTAIEMGYFIPASDGTDTHTYNLTLGTNIPGTPAKCVMLSLNKLQSVQKLLRAV